MSFLAKVQRHHKVSDAAYAAKTSSNASLFEKAAKVANEGHYLDRLIGIMEVFKIDPDLKDIVKAVRKYVMANGKPGWVDGLRNDVSYYIIHILETKFKAQPEDWEKVVWGLDWNALEHHGLTKYRKKG